MKNKIIFFLKLFVLIFPMVQGFFYTFALAWFAVGLQLTAWVIIALYALACLAVYGVYRWLSEG